MKRTNDTKIGCLGEVMLELIPATGDAARLGIAGDTYNTAVYLAREDIAVDYITVLGHDGFSDRIRRHMTSYHVGTGRLVTHQTRIPGLYAIETDDHPVHPHDKACDCCFRRGPDWQAPHSTGCGAGNAHRDRGPI